MASAIIDKCTNCGACEPICPTKSITPGAYRFKIDSDTCSDCQYCIAVCPVDAIRAIKGPEKKSADKKHAG